MRQGWDAIENRLSVRVRNGSNTLLWDAICCVEALLSNTYALARNKRAGVADCWKTNNVETMWEINILSSAQD